jgi:hypothetical protein
LKQPGISPQFVLSQEVEAVYCYPCPEFEDGESTHDEPRKLVMNPRPDRLVSNDNSRFKVVGEIFGCKILGCVASGNKDVEGKYFGVTLDQWVHFIRYEPPNVCFDNCCR